MSRKLLSPVLLSAILLGLVHTKSARGQLVQDNGTWLALLSQGKASDYLTGADRVKWWFDAHARFFDDSGGFGQSILRPGIGYELTENSAIWAGYAWIRTSPISQPDVDENRIWQQLTWSKSVEPLKLGLRSRLEQRFLETGSDTGWRFRQFVRAQTKVPGKPRCTLVCWDEAFLNLNDTDWGARTGFGQNRLFIGFGFKPVLDGRWRTEVGYLNQAINVPGPVNRTNHLISINFFRSP